MTNKHYSADELAEHYQISPEQAARYIARFGSDREELDRLLGSSSRTPVHRDAEMARTSTNVALG